MGMPNLMNTGRSGMMAAKAAIGTAGHNIANANTEGYSRQKVETSTAPSDGSTGRVRIGTGVNIERVSRLNDQYLEKQIRQIGSGISNMEEKDIVLKQTEDVFNELGGEGLNRLMSKFFNDFRKLANDPGSEALRQSVRESSLAMVNDFHRIRSEVEGLRQHVDARITGYVSEVNAITNDLKDLNIRIKTAEYAGAEPNDLLDKREVLLKKLNQYLELSMYQDGGGSYVVDISGVGPLVTGPQVEKLSIETSPADPEFGKPEGAVDIKTSGSAQGSITHQIRGGKLGALIESRDQALSVVLDRIDELAFMVSNTVNTVHEKGVTREGKTDIGFFNNLASHHRAAEFLDLSAEVKENVNNIATAYAPDSPGDNRIAIAISNLQGAKLLNNGCSTMDDFYNSIVSDVGVVSARNRSSLNQTKDIEVQLGKMREQISGVSIDEETANLMQFNHLFEASAKLIQIADEMTRTILELKR